jgi:hypothetical protein
MGSHAAKTQLKVSLRIKICFVLVLQWLFPVFSQAGYPIIDQRVYTGTGNRSVFVSGAQPSFGMVRAVANDRKEYHILAMIVWFLVGCAAIGLGREGLSKDGLPFTAKKRITGMPGKIIGTVCIVIGVVIAIWLPVGVFLDILF